MHDLFISFHYNGRFAQQQILNERLYEKYTRIVITRSDYLWVVSPVREIIIIIKLDSLWLFV